MRTVGAIFVLSLITLGLGLLILEPYALVALAVALGIAKPPFDVVVTERFLGALPYLAPIGPIVWTAFQRPGGAWNRTRAAHDS